MSEKEIQKNQKKLEECEKQAGEYLGGWKRAQADLLNYKKEESSRIESAIKFANEDLVIQLVSFIDEFDIALSHLPEKVRDENSEWVTGLENIKSKFISFLSKNGVTKIETIGEDFDPLRHESIGESEGGKSGTVVEEVQPGYEIGGKIIRAAKVRISK
ncbi:MAG: nucleotide exchange factor GrpE [Candidatus Yanofskybacteria bacterium CG10_big_fil_rev_8_21_14_0_10_36_16]|uniref:Protein GrpE n=1 Tax=Candidatus Yanofskybacteria bacterium CG10_big_fil_rev_8_21_14_0_10_36_16 TaxID=1975096 RepID=A0A2J0Q8F8_9BACT|nr:MAG: nucleotide exchange factor GrpE [Candidatus Yanofskybacteria bacterium CG10_big_fil_rev_8_21_14_0_10_36_16]